MKNRQLLFRASVMLSLVAWHHLPRPQVARCGLELGSFGDSKERLKGI